jgi:peptide-methionine (S)-S-oxide reductase
MEKATFGAGCFWGVEEAFRKMEGVVSTRVGYTGGHTSHPTYKLVCTSSTGHAEVVEVTFDPSVVSYEQLLEVFWKIHNPTTLNKQGPDIGTQYRSVIFFHTPAQKETAVKSKEEAQEKRLGKIVTEILPASSFYEAEEYHQQYYQKHGGSCNR